MRFTLFIAFRYLFSKKSRNVINVITAISMVAVCIISASLVVLLSAFNGLEGKIEELFSAFDPSLKVQPVSGKTLAFTEAQLTAVSSIEGVDKVCRTVEESVLFVYNGQQYIGRLKGVDDSFLDMVSLDTMMREGAPVLHSGKRNFALMGEEIASALNVNMDDPTRYIQVYYPKRGKVDLLNPFRESMITPGGVFTLQQDFSRYVIVPLGFASGIMDYNGQVTALEIKLKPGASEGLVKKKLRELLGGSVTVKNRYEQQELMYKVLKSEKLAMFLIVTLILVIASFNLVSSLTMLVVEKKKDIMVLWSLGATFRKVKWIYIMEGTLVAVLGAVSGLMIGASVVFVQLQTGVVKLGDYPESPAYPVKFNGYDFLAIFLTVVAIGFLASWLRMKGIKFDRQDNFALLR